MSASTLATLLAMAKLGLQFATGILTLLNSKNLLEAGQAQQVARDLAALQVRLGISKDVEAAVAALSDEEINAELRGP